MNELKKNTIKQEQNKPLKKAPKESSVEGDFVEKELKNVSKKRFLGYILLLFSAISFVSIISYFFTGKTDHDQVLGKGISYLISDSGEATNWMGRFGALVSHLFLFEGFGIGSLGIIILMFFVGLKSVFSDFNKKVFPLVLPFLIGSAVVSLTLAYLFKILFVSELDFLGGNIGYQIGFWLKGFVGVGGLGLGLVVFWVGFLIAFKNIEPSLVSLKSLFSLKPKPEIDDEISQQAKAVNKENEILESLENEPYVLDEEDEAMDFTFFDRDKTQNDEAEDIIVFDPGIKPKEKPTEKTKNLSFEIIDASEAEVTAPEHAFEIVKPVKEAMSDSETAAEDIVASQGPYDPRLDLSSYKFPIIDLLVDHGNQKLQINAEELEKYKNQIIETLGHYNIEIDKIRATVGPTVTLYEIVPAAGVRISKIKNLEDDIALSLAALGIRIIAPMPGKGTIGIEVPNKNKETVSMKSLLSSEKFVNCTYELPLALGRTISNEIYIADLAKMPHLLMAGATGQGKSVGINSILASLLFKKHPSELKFVLVDPKKVELSLFQTIERHFLAKLPGEEDAIITDTQKVVKTLVSLTVEMDARYELLKNAQVRNIIEYNQKFIKRKLNPNDGHRYLPYIVLVVDEFADLIMTAGKEVEMPIARLAQLARAIGIHLIIATQRPSVNIITGTIKANFPARIAFKVSSKIDSRTILDTGGAEQLIGRGDMLLLEGSNIVRIQCGFLDTPEVDQICEFIGSQRGYPDAYILPEVLDEGGESQLDWDPTDRDVLFDEAARIIVHHQQGSTSLLQRRLKLGYNRAGRLIDQLEAAGIVGPFEGSKAREVLIPDEYSLEQFLSQLNK